jgi:hypothetical protein
MTGMVATVLLTVAIVFVLLAGWAVVQAAARRTAADHPEHGPYRDIGADHGCSDGCGGCGEASHCRDAAR